MFSKSIVAALLVGALATSAVADVPQPIALDPITHNTGALVITRADGTEVRYTPAELEMLDTYRLRTTTPWRDEPADFDGVLLSDLLQLNGLADLDEVQVIAENDFVSSFPRALWETVPVLIATRVDGQPHSRRERGPIQFVISQDDFTASDLATEAHLVWMAARIEPE